MRRGIEDDFDPSLPSRGRGLKSCNRHRDKSALPVAPLAGAWIEIFKVMGCRRYRHVAPLAGAWIEIRTNPKYHRTARVAPLAGAWIEIDMTG